MEEKGDPTSCLIVSEARDDSLCAMYFGVSCAFFALKCLSRQALLDDHKCMETRDKMLQGSAQLLGLLLWRVRSQEVKRTEKCDLLQKLEIAERKVSELKRIRSEDAKANDKVASIYAAQEQSWFAERRRLQHQIGGLLKDMRILNKQKNDIISELNGKVYEMEVSIKSKDKILEEEQNQRKEMEEKMKSMETVLEELKETTKREAHDHSAELLKHKTAFIELVSNYRHLEAELGRALRQAEAAKQQLDFVFEEKEEALLLVEQLSLKIEKMQMDSEKKDKILSATTRKLKFDSAGKQMLMKEVKLSKPKRKKSGSRNGRQTLRNMLSDVDGIKAEHNHNVLDDFVGEDLKEHEEYSPHLEPSFPQESAEFDKATRLDEWVHLEAEKYRNAVEQRHQLELDAFTDEIQMKDDKLEAYCWKLRSTELESKRLQSQIESLNQNMSQLRRNNLKLEALLLDREVELKRLKDQIALQLNKLAAQKIKLHSSSRRHELSLVDDTDWSKVGFTKKKSAKKEEETECVSSKGTCSTFLSSIEEKAASVHPLPACVEASSPEGSETNGKEVVAKLWLNKRDKSQWKVDLHALGVSYKIKRLSQQLLMLDRLAGNQEGGEVKASDEHGLIRRGGFLIMFSLLNKQVSRYQSLQQKTDELSQRMVEKDLYLKQGVSGSSRTKEETKILKQFLEETFQLQRFIVASGQKLSEIQSKLSSSGLVEISKELNGCAASFDMKRFSDTIQSLFKDVQRGLEVRIARIIGDLGGTLACDGIHARKYTGDVKHLHPS